MKNGKLVFIEHINFFRFQLNGLYKREFIKMEKNEQKIIFFAIEKSINL